MKNSKEYSKKINNLYRSLKRKYPKISQTNHEQVMDALIYAIICEKMSDRKTESAIKRFNEYFVDMNDLRVSRSEEIIEMLGENTPATMCIASTITKVLRSIFNQNHKVNLEGLKKIGKRPARQTIEKIDGISRFVTDYCMLTSLQSHAIPLTETMIAYLRNYELVDAEADEQQIAGFLTKLIPAKNGYEFYTLLRHESETQKSKKTTKTKAKTEKKTKSRKKKKK
jgi:endonuclease III